MSMTLIRSLARSISIPAKTQVLCDKTIPGFVGAVILMGGTSVRGLSPSGEHAMQMQGRACGDLSEPLNLFGPPKRKSTSSEES